MEQGQTADARTRPDENSKPRMEISSKSQTSEVDLSDNRPAASIHNINNDPVQTIAVLPADQVSFEETPAVQRRIEAGRQQQNSKTSKPDQPDGNYGMTQSQEDVSGHPEQDLPLSKHLHNRQSFVQGMQANLAHDFAILKSNELEFSQAMIQRTSLMSRRTTDPGLHPNSSGHQVPDLPANSATQNRSPVPAAIESSSPLDMQFVQRQITQPINGAGNRETASLQPAQIKQFMEPITSTEFTPPMKRVDNSPTVQHLASQNVVQRVSDRVSGNNSRS